MVARVFLAPACRTRRRRQTLQVLPAMLIVASGAATGDIFAGTGSLFLLQLVRNFAGLDEVFCGDLGGDACFCWNRSVFCYYQHVFLLQRVICFATTGDSGTCFFAGIAMVAETNDGGETRAKTMGNVATTAAPRWNRPVECRNRQKGISWKPMAVLQSRRPRAWAASWHCVGARQSCNSSAVG
ncbi:uncharacterized protein [Triticum aestivum]|uniref:uncharacterized protein n=1 Tax=Triticum aestivum TaxID=4565 RepID=UPI001D0072CD|nr:uncharacterized protein LOC123157959 [Triticum aestivum]